MSKRLIALILGALAVGLIAGCGSSGGSSSDSTDGSGSEITTSSLSKAEYIKQANAICTKYHDKFVSEGEIYVKKHGIPKPSEQPAFFATFAELVAFPTARVEAEKLVALGAPSGSEDDVAAMLAAMEKGIAEGEKTSREVKKSDKPTSRPPELEKADELAKKFGLGGDCLVT